MFRRELRRRPNTVSASGYSGVYTCPEELENPRIAVPFVSAPTREYHREPLSPGLEASLPEAAPPPVVQVTLQFDSSRTTYLRKENSEKLSLAR